MNTRLTHQRGSLAQRLTWLTVIITGAALLAACAAFIVYDRITYRALLLRHLAVQAHIIAENSVSALIFADPNSAAKTLATLSASHDIRSAGIYTRHGRLFAFYRRDSAAPLPARAPPMPAFGHRHWSEDNRIVLIRRIHSAGAFVGSILIRSDIRQLARRERHYLEIAAVVWAAALAAAWLFSASARGAFVRPIAALATTASQIARQGDYSLRAPDANGRTELAELVNAFNSMVAAVQTRDAELALARQQLEQRVEERTEQLTVANRELEAFSYSVSHDLRAPLRGIDGFSQALLEDYGSQMDDAAHGYLDRIRAATQRMGVLIDDLLQLARVSRTEMRLEDCDLSAMAESIMDDLRRSAPQRAADIAIEPGLRAWADPTLLRSVLENLLGNAWKFTAKRATTRIALRRQDAAGAPVFSISDNGAGFDPAHAGQLFSPFQRLHPTSEFPGTGIGLATVQRILQRHGGRAWADAKPGEGATFYFTLRPSPTDAPIPTHPDA